MSMYFWKLICLIFLVQYGQSKIIENDIPGRTALDNFPLIDTHNDLPNNLYERLHNKIRNFSFDTDLAGDALFGFKACDSCHTDLPRLKQGKVGGQFWVAYVECATQYKNAVTRTMEQIDVIKRLIKKYPNEMEFVTTANDILASFKRKKLASLIGVEGGHSIDYKLSLLRIYYDLGVRYLTLTHQCNTPWADSSIADSIGRHVYNLTEFGKKVVLEMNRLGMMVDLSHVSHNVMVEAMGVSRAPVLFSHSGAFAVHSNPRNVKDSVLEQLKSNGGVIMVYFYCPYVGAGNVTIYDVMDHINHIVDVIGIDHVGLGSDFDGVDCVPQGLEDVSKYPDLFDKLRQLNPTRWTIANLEKLAGANFVRVFREVEKVRDQLVIEQPNEDSIVEEDLTRVKPIIRKCSAT